MSQAVEEFIGELVLHFPRREMSEADDVAWVSSMTRNLEGFSPTMLRKGAQIIIDTCDRRSFQWLPKQCKEACFEAKKILDAEKPSLKFTGPRADANYDDREKLARELLLCPMGKAAACEGWIFSLFTFIRDHARLPAKDRYCGDRRKMHTEHGVLSEVDCCQRGGRGTEQAIDRLRALPPSQMNKTFINMGLEALEKRNKLTAYVETGVLP